MLRSLIAIVARLFSMGLFVALGGTLLMGAAHAADVAGSSDHPLVGRYQGSEIVGYRVTEFDEVKTVEGPFDPAQAGDRTGPGFKTLEGRIVLIYYKLPESRSTLEVLRNFQDSLKSKGFSIVFTCTPADGSCFESKQPDAAYFVGTAIGDPLTLPRLMDDYVHNYFQQGARYLLARLDRPEGAVYVSLFLGDSTPNNVAVLRVVETKEMETGKIEFLNSSQMEKAIADTGKVSLYGILFDFDKDTLKPESKPTLDEIAKLLGAKSDLKLKIVGHTDNQGTADYNLDLSKRRAANVAAALVQDYSIAADRLSSEGAGLTQPVASNDTEDGRAKNRRVELIAQ
jgi:outer membrane protein OmpA-like peptidoglycan-associated protein